TISGLSDTVHAAPQIPPGTGDVKSGNFFGSAKLDNCSTANGPCTQTTAKGEGIGLTGKGTRTEPWQNAEKCTLPTKSRINVESSSQYTVTTADFEKLEKDKKTGNAILKDTAELEWKNTCDDPAKLPNGSCNTDPPPNDGGVAQVLIEPIAS